MTDSSAAKPVSKRGTARVAHTDPRTVVVAFAGSWRIDSDLPVPDSVLGQIAGLDRGRTLLLDGGELTEWDSILLVFIRTLEAAAVRAGATVSRERLPPGLQTLLKLTETGAETLEIHHTDQPDFAFLERIGISTVRALDAVEDVLVFVGRATIALGRLIVGRAHMRGSDLALQVQDTGIRALPVVSLISVLTGLIFAFVGAIQLRVFGAQIYVANLVAISMLREMGAIMTAIIMAGRTGAAYAAELGTMQVNEELDALTTAGFDPMEFLVLPRMLALIAMMPLLCVYADALGIAGGALISGTLLGIPFQEYWQQTLGAATLVNLFIGIVKAGVFGVLIALTGCLQGMRAGRSAAAVGLAATSAVVVSIVLIVCFDGLFAVVLNILNL
ncbi:MAG TPA: ABC transporter permease [Alphaproteobacteria bacterium]|nr:ABC transporter permease [Alphaproteobacteria bacterium]